MEIPGADIQRPKFDANIPLPSLGELLSSDYNVNPPKLNIPEVKGQEEIDLSRPSIDIPPVEIERESPKEIPPRRQSFRPTLEIPGISLEVEPTSNINNINVDLKHPPIDIPAVDIKPPEIELKPKVVLPSLENIVSEKSPYMEMIQPQLGEITAPTIATGSYLPQKIDEEPESDYVPPLIDFDTNACEQPPLISSLLSADPDKPYIVGSKANKPDINFLKSKSRKQDYTIEPSFNIEEPSDKEVEKEMDKYEMEKEPKLKKDKQKKRRRT